MNNDISNQRYIFNIFNKVGDCVIYNTRQVPILDNPTDYKVAIEAFTLVSSESFVDTVKLIFETNYIPVNQTNLSANLDIQRKQVGEYYLNRDESDSKNNYISYMADSYRLYDLNSDTPLRTFDLYVYKQSSSGVITPVKLDESSGLSLTLIFLKNKRRS